MTIFQKTVLLSCVSFGVGVSVMPQSVLQVVFQEPICMISIANSSLVQNKATLEIHKTTKLLVKMKFHDTGGS